MELITIVQSVPGNISEKTKGIPSSDVLECIGTIKPNISCTLVGDKTVDNSYVVVASPVGGAPTTSSFSTIDIMPGFNGLGKDNCKTRWETFKVLGFGVAYIRGLMEL